MEKRLDLQNAVEKEISERIARYIIGEQEQDSFGLYEELTRDGFIEVDSPEEEPPMMSFLLMDSLDGFVRGRSIKPGNILLNMKHLIDSIPNIIMRGYNIAESIPIVKVCAGLEIWKMVLKISTVEITKEQAFVIVALWKNCDHKYSVELEKGREAVNILYKKSVGEEMDKEKYNQIIDKLVMIKCIELVDGIVYMKEKISHRYIDSI